MLIFPFHWFDEVIQKDNLHCLLGETHQQVQFCEAFSKSVSYQQLPDAQSQIDVQSIMASGQQVMCTHEIWLSDCAVRAKIR